MISDEKRDKALTYLAETDISAAEARADVERQEYILKQIKAAAYLDSMESTIDAKKADVEIDQSVLDQKENCIQSLIDYQGVANKRETARLIIEVWRSENANRRQGGI